MQLITDNSALRQFCSHALNQPVLALDTEFVRQSTLYPKLGLIQLNDGQQLALVDPLTITDWQPLIELLSAEQVIKVIHSCNEDIEALMTIGIQTIQPLFDTQVAAELLGWGSSVGYARLVEQVTGHVLDKSESRTDWLARPLRQTQLAYAANDVEFLLTVYQSLQQQLTSPLLQQLLLAEGVQFTQRRKQALPAEYKYLDIKNSWMLSPRELAVLKALAGWRQQYATEKDLALGLVMKEFQLLELAKRRPSSVESLLNIPGMNTRDVKRHAATIIALINQAKAVPSEQCPIRFSHQASFAGYKEVMNQLGLAVKEAAEQAAIPAEFMSVKRQMQEYMNWCWRVTDEQRSDLPLPEYLQGWRREYLLPYLPVPEHVAALI